MKSKSEIIPALWKDMTEPVSLDEYANQMTQRMADQPMDLSHLADDPLPWGWDLETVQAAYDPALLHDRFRTGDYTFDKQRADRVYADRAVYAAKPGGQEPYYYYVPGDGKHERRPPDALTQKHRPAIRWRAGADFAGGVPPAGSEYGAHGHPNASFLDDLAGTDGFGDNKSLFGPRPVPMATVVTIPDGPNRGQQVVGYREMVNGRLQLRVPAGTLSDVDRKAIQDNLDRAQQKFYK